MKFWPARTSKKQNGPVADLDAIVAEPVYFRYGGNVHTLKPMSLETFLRFTNAQSSLMDSLREDKTLTGKELAERYHDVISSVCDTITVNDILSMEQVQVAALYQLVIDLVTGQVDMGGGESKKKRQKINIYESVQASSSPSSLGSLAGPLESP